MKKPSLIIEKQIFALKDAIWVLDQEIKALDRLAELTKKATTLTEIEKLKKECIALKESKNAY